MPYNPNPYVYSSVPVMPVYPTYTQPYQQAQAPQQPQQTTQPAPQSQQPEQLVSGGFVVIPTEADVKRYPVAPGNLVTFKIENEPIVIEKSMGRSQFSSPEYRYYKLSEYNNQTEVEASDDKPKEASASDDAAFVKKSFEHIEKRLESLSDSYVELKKLLNKRQEVKPVKKEGDDV